MDVGNALRAFQKIFSHLDFRPISQMFFEHLPHVCQVHLQVPGYRAGQSAIQEHIYCWLAVFITSLLLP